MKNNVKIVDKSAGIVYYMRLEVFNRTFLSDTRVFLASSPLVRIENSEFVIRNSDEILKCRGSITHMIEKYLEYDVETAATPADPILMFNYLGWTIRVFDRSNHPHPQFSWRISDGQNEYVSAGYSKTAEAASTAAKSKVFSMRAQDDSQNL
jgi:hypothetical protein